MAAKLSKGGGSKFELGQNSDINVTPFVDVMLVLLIIFMVAAPLATVSIPIDIPPPDPNAVKPPKPPVIVNVFPYGKVYLGSKPTTRETLVADLTAALGSATPTEEAVLIEADRQTHYADFMSVLNVLQNGGFHKLDLVAEDL